ncbi:unnamed protein product, partial [Brassica rapa]
IIEEVPCGALFLLWNGSALVGTVLVGPLLKSFPRS